MGSMSDGIIATDNWARVAHRDAIKLYDEGGWNSQRRAMSLEKQGGFWNKTQSWGQAIAAWAQYATGTAVERYGPKDLADWVSMPIDAVGAGIGVALPKNLHTYRKAGEELLNEVALPYVFRPSITRRVAASTAIDVPKYANWITDGLTTTTDALGDSKPVRVVSFSSIPVKRTPVLKMRSSDTIPNPRSASSSGSLRMRPSTGSLGRIAIALPASPDYARPSSLPRSLQARPSSPTFSQTAIGLPTSPNYGRLSTFARGLYASPSSPTLGQMAKGIGPSSSYARPSTMPGGLKTSSFSGSSNKEGGLRPLPSVYSSSISMSGGPHPGVSNRSLSSTTARGHSTSPLSSSLSGVGNSLTPNLSFGSPSSIGSPRSTSPFSGSLSSIGSSLSPNSSLGNPVSISSPRNTSSFSSSTIGTGPGFGSFSAPALKNMTRPSATSSNSGFLSGLASGLTPRAAAGGGSSGAFGGIGAGLSGRSAAAHR